MPDQPLQHADTVRVSMADLDLVLAAAGEAVPWDAAEWAAYRRLLRAILTGGQADA